MCSFRLVWDVLSGEGCRARQQRLLEAMAERRWELFVTSNYRTVYYCTGQLVAPDAPVAFLLWVDGRSALVAPAADHALVDTARIVPVYQMERGVPLPHQDAAAAVLDLVSSRPVARRVAVDRTSAISPCIDGLTGEDASSAVLALRRCKEPDEVDEIRFSLKLCAAAYDAARVVMRPGITELDVFLTMQNVIAQVAGAPVAFPGDFAAGERSLNGGGAATMRELQAGDLFPLDLFPAPALYFGDVCRTFCVGGRPAALQQEAFALACEALALGERLLKPGARGSDVYWKVKEFLDDRPVTKKSFGHHVGHGIGLHGHEAPRLVPLSEDVLKPGDVVTVEPGIYVAAHQGGIRVENNYLITETGCEKLFDYPLSLIP
jgi:Xaa-Pro dipeptidase